jgi:hypothetical protein
LAIIIPVVGNTEGLEGTLLSVLERRPDDCDLIVATNVPYDDPYKLQGEIQILQAPTRSGLVDCVNRGIQSTAAPVVHILAGGSQATDGWIDRTLHHFDNPQVAAVIPLVYDIARPEHLLSAGLSYRGHGRTAICGHIDSPAQVLIGPILGAAFYRKSVLDAIGGLPSAVGDELAAADLALTLHEAVWRLELEPACRILAQQSAQPSAAGFRSGLHSERLYWRHFDAHGRLTGLLAHPLIALREIARASPWWKIPANALGRLVSFIQFGQHRQARQILASAAAALKLAQTQAQISSADDNSARQPASSQRRIDPAHSAATAPLGPSQARRKKNPH